jgi:bifunctional UDP-N-acetylglucosamine pyrophosphorylase/glucosamine-1-phosphate N-acetyltransferase
LKKERASVYFYNMKDKVKIVILAAGKGTRMNSVLPKALADLHGKHMVRHLLESIEKSEVGPRPIIVVGYEKELVMKELGDSYHYAIQEEQLGTGHAVMAAKEACGDAENIMIISADQPFIKSETIKNLWEKHQASNATLTIVTTILPDFEDWRRAFLTYGRILRKDGKIIDKEVKDCTPEELAITEVNVSCYIFKAEWLWANIQKLDRNSNKQKEYQLTDLWQIAGDSGQKIESVQVDAMETLGVNSKEELEILEKLAV